MQRSEPPEYRQACNAQAVVYAESSQLSWSPTWLYIQSDKPTFAATILAMQHTMACRVICPLFLDFSMSQTLQPVGAVAGQGLAA